MGRVAVVTAALLLALTAAPARAQDASSIPEGPTDAPRFTGKAATPQPIQVPPLAPAHPFMARNPWNNIHNDPYMTDTYPGPGPLGVAMTRRSQFKARECASVTFDSRGRIVTICVGLDRPVLTLMDPTTLGTIATYDLPPRNQRPGGGAFNDFSGGGYFFLDERDRATMPTTDRRLLTIAAGDAGFTVEREVSLASVVPEGDGIVSALPDWSGRIWFVTQSGVVGNVGTDGAVRAKPMNERITDSFAVDETGGVFVVTNGALYRFDAGPDGGPSVTWRETYDNAGVQKPGQVSPGSGTTPTLMDGGLVAIADNAEHMQVAVYRRGRELAPPTPRLVCEQQVFERGKGATDNSLIAAGRSIVVENNYGYASITSTQNGDSTEPGIERVDVDPDTNTCRSVWRSQERSSSVVPKLSLANGLVYAYVKEPDPDDDLWYFTAIDFRTGATVWKFLAGEGLGFNNNYAPVTLGPDGTAYVGVLGGIVRIADRVPPPGALIPDRQATPPAGGSADAGGRCVARRAALARTGVGPVRIDEDLATLIDDGGLPLRRSVRFCVFGGGRVSAALDRRNRAELIGTTARGHRIRGVARGVRTSTFRKRFRERRRVARGVYRSGRVLVHVRRGRVTWVAVVSPSISANRVRLRAAIRNAGL